MIGHYLANCAGDRCTFPEEEAVRLVEQGLAVFAEKRQPVEVATAEASPEAAHAQATRGQWAGEVDEASPAPAPASSPLPEAWTKSAPRKR
jgi:hypothetical protein